MAAMWHRWILLACVLLVPLSGNAATPMLAASNSGSLFLNSDGSVWRPQGAPSPVRELQLPNVIAIAQGEGADLALLADGTLWGSGSNSLGLLGDGTKQSRSQAQPVPGLAGITAVSASWHVLAVRNDGTVWSWGENLFGQLGDSTRIDRYAPQQISGLTGITQVSASRTGSLALKSDGTVWVWGQTGGGAAGNGLSAFSETDPEYFHLTPTQVHNLDGVIAISAGQANHHLALRSDGTVWTWGAGLLGMNGTGLAGLAGLAFPAQVPGLDHVIAIEARGLFLSLALKSDGTVWAWGDNSHDLLGVSGITYSTSPIQIPGLTDIVAIAATSHHVLAMRRDGTVVAWGSNANGELCDNTLQDRAQPQPLVGPGGTGLLNLVQPAPAHINQLPRGQISLSANSGRAPLTVAAAALNATDADGTVAGYLWKTNDGQTGSGPTATFSFTQAGTYGISLLIEDNLGGRSLSGQQVVVAPGTAVSMFATPKVGTDRHGSIALANDGRILTWGTKWNLGLYDAGAQNALPDTYSIPIANGIGGAIDVALWDVIHILLADGTVLGWGPDAGGSLGTGVGPSNSQQPTALVGLPPARALAAGPHHRLALTRDGRVFAWGLNGDGQLGLGDTQNRFQPTEIADISNVSAIGAGSSSSYALKSDGTVWGWGGNQGYQLADGTQVSRTRPTQLYGLAGVAKIFAMPNGLIAQKTDGSAWVAGTLLIQLPGDFAYSTELRHIPLLDNILQAAGGNRHMIVLRPDGSVWTGGLESSGALGFEQIGDVNGLKQVPGVSDAIAVAAGEQNSMVVRRDGTVLSWGQNFSGQIGDGTLVPQRTPVFVVNETANGFLDLIPEVPNTIPQDKIPPFFLATYANGSLSSTTLYADVKGITASGTFAANDAGRFAAGYNVYIAASVPTSVSAPYFQLNPNNSWSVLHWPMAQFMSSVALDSQNNVVRAQILENADLSSPLFAGTSVMVGYGTDPDEMLRAGRYRTIFTVTQP